ncbi:MAG: pantoate--beta-alanine ligase [Burkholderiales bacterium]
MDVIHTVRELRERLREERRVALVPTMGNLHEGHIQLIRIVKPKAACLIASIFVNRLQFGPKDDFNKYPRTLQGDCEKLDEAGCHVVFAPTEEEVYPEPQAFTVEPSSIQNILEGEFRAGHFRGVATVVLKLFNMVQPQIAIFGKKDYQQFLVLRDMVRQFQLPIDIIPAETVRADDGLALSSRNSYLSSRERSEAIRLHDQLSKVRAAIFAGQQDFAAVELAAKQHLDSHGWKTDYVAIRRQQDLLPPGEQDKHLVVLGASKLGATRLIDNLEIDL